MTDKDRILYATSNRRIALDRPGLWTAHSERRAFDRYRRYFPKPKNATIYVIRIRSNGSVGMAMPCINCRILLYASPFSEVWYTNEEGIFERLKFS